MKLYFKKIGFHRLHILSTSVFWVLAIFSIVWVLQLISPGTVNAFHSKQPISVSQSSFRSQTRHLLNVVISPTASASVNTNGNTSSQDSQAQNDFSIANTIITLAGVVIALAGLVLAFITIGGAIAGFFGVREFRRLREFRRNIATMEQKLKEQQEQLEKTTTGLKSNQEEFNHLKEEGEKLENRLAQLKSEISEIVEQRFLEASYYFNEGTNAYRDGDNEHAIESYLHAKNIQPKNLSILERLGRAYSNIDDMKNAYKYLKEAEDIDPENEAVLSSLAQYYRYKEPETARNYLKSIVQKNPLAFEAWDFLGLFYRDQLKQGQQLIKNQEIIEKAIDAHQKALTIKKRPETEFYLSILLLFSPKGDKMYAGDLMKQAAQDILEKEHDQRIRPVWTILIQAGPDIIFGKKIEALQLIQSLKRYITTERIHEAVEGHILFLLEGTNHADWIPEFLDTVKFKEP